MKFLQDSLLQKFLKSHNFASSLAGNQVLYRQRQQRYRISRNVFSQNNMDTYTSQNEEQHG